MSLADELNESGVKMKYDEESGDFVLDGALPEGVVFAGASGDAKRSPSGEFFDVKDSKEAAFFDSSVQRWFKLG